MTAGSLAQNGIMVILLMAATVACPLGAGWLLLERRLKDSKIRWRVEQARSRATGQILAEPIASKSAIAPLVAALGSAITSSGLLSTKTRTELEQTLRAGGLTVSHNLELFIGTKITLSLVLPLIVFALLRHSGMRPLLLLALVVASGVAGLMLPNMVIGRRRRITLRAVDNGLADGLDMMVICAEAGLALEAAIQRVSVEVVHAHPKLAAELAKTYSDLSISSDARVALNNMGDRTGLVSLKRLAATLIQSVQYGTPLSSALRTLATELRQETLTRFEERAAKLPVLLTLPMILFILPCVFLIVAGPIVVQVMKAMYN